MDYETQATNRRELRACAKLFRSICGVSQDEPIDPVALLDKLPDLEALLMAALSGTLALYSASASCLYQSCRTVPPSFW